MSDELEYERLVADILKASKPIALAAFNAAGLAKSAALFPEAMDAYDKAVVLDPDNLEYLDAAKDMATTLGRTEQAQNYAQQIEVLIHSNP